MNAPHRQPGFVLIMTLIIVVIAATLLVGVARQSVGAMLDASTAAKQLQRRWAALSIEHAVLPHAAELLQEHPDKQTTIDLAFRTLRFQLNGEPVTVVIADEQAKVNVNTLLRLKDRETAGPLIRNLTPLGAATSESVTVQLHPFGIGGTGPKVVRTLGQVFTATRPAALAPELAERSALANVTLWGSGKLNVHTASPESIRALFDALNAGAGARPDGLTSLRDQHPDWDLSTLLAALNLRDSDRAKIEPMLTDHSDVQSVWITIGGGDSEHSNGFNRRTDDFAVIDRSDPEHPAIIRRTW